MRLQQLIRGLLSGIATCLLTFNTAHADAPEWVKSPKDFESLYISISQGSDCPFTEQDLRRKVEGELYRARITPAKKWNHVFLGVYATCMRSRVGGRHAGYTMYQRFEWCRNAYSFDHSGGILPAHISCSGVSDAIVTGGIDGSATYFLQSIQEDIGNILTDFIKVNMVKPAAADDEPDTLQ